jgi:hypothetical protein
MGGLVSAVFGGGNSPPPPPDYTKLAKETAAGNREMADYTTRANRINQSNPFGSLTYNYTPQMKFDEAGYNKAMQGFDPNAGGVAPTREDFTKETGSGWSQSMNLTPENQALFDKQMAMSNQYADLAQRAMGQIGQTGNNQTNNAQQLASRFASGGGGFGGGVSAVGMPSARDVNMDLSGLRNVEDLTLEGLPQAPINAGQTAQDAIFSRLNPTLSRDDEALRTRLANQGIQLGSSAYNREMDLQGQRANDLRLQAAAQGISLDQAARQQALGEQQSIFNSQMGQRQQGLTEQQALANVGLTQRGQDVSSATTLGAAGIGANASLEAARMNAAINAQNSANQYDIQNRNLRMSEQLAPIQYVNALRAGSQAQMPTFNNFSSQANLAGPDLASAGMQQYNAQMGLFNAGEARDERNQQMMMQAAGMFFSDRRTKENIQKIGVLDNGLNLYKFDYKPEFKELAGHGSFVGVMADEAKVIPNAVIRQPNGYDMVDYSKIYA